MPTRHQENERKRWFKDKALAYGFQQCRVAAAGPLPEESRRLEQWLAQGRHGAMGYMERHFDERTDPTKLLPGARSVVSLAMNYYPGDELQPGAEAGYPKVSRYAWGRDYHKVLRGKMKHFIREAQQAWGQFSARGFVDSAPVMDKAWAARSGVGWIGKHTNLLNRPNGSYFFLAEIVTDLAMSPDVAVGDYCGRCTRCIDACPTGAITAPYQLDARRCISYLTIEIKDNADPALAEKMEDWVFGCDICQEVCPWNRFSKPHQEPDFAPRNDLPARSARQWKSMSKDEFEERFAGMAIRRATYEGMMRNLSDAGF
jgi:epoxyqueuosine reductase